MRLGAHLTTLRQMKGESLQEVADAVGVSKAHIWELEKGRTDNPSMGLVVRLADHFGVSVAFLVGEDLDAADDDVELQQMFRQARTLDARERALLSSMMKSLIESRPRN
jgi:transcriptional regulator with XRE-family HTH domain